MPKILLCFWRNFFFYVILFGETSFGKTSFSELDLAKLDLAKVGLAKTSFIGVDWMCQSFPRLRQVIHWLRQWHFALKPKMTSQTAPSANKKSLIKKTILRSQCITLILYTEVTKNANRLECAFPQYVKNVLLTKRQCTLFYTNTWIINFKWKILSISPTKLPAQTSVYAEEK